MNLLSSRQDSTCFGGNERTLKLFSGCDNFLVQTCLHALNSKNRKHAVASREMKVIRYYSMMMMVTMVVAVLRLKKWHDADFNVNK